MSARGLARRPMWGSFTTRIAKTQPPAVASVISQSFNSTTAELGDDLAVRERTKTPWPEEALTATNTTVSSWILACAIPTVHAQKLEREVFDARAASTYTVNSGPILEDCTVEARRERAEGSDDDHRQVGEAERTGFSLQRLYRVRVRARTAVPIDVQGPDVAVMASASASDITTRRSNCGHSGCGPTVRRRMAWSIRRRTRPPPSTTPTR